jgi:ribosomal protein S3
MPIDETVVQTASEAAEGLVFSRFRRSDVDDFDVTVTFDDGVLEVDVWIHAPDVDTDAEAVAEDATLAARNAVDDLFDDTDEAADGEDGDTNATDGGD